MYRHKINDLISWKDKGNRKPLVMNGARQVGKSWLVEYFGKEHFGQVVTLNLEKRKDLHPIFEKNLDVNRIIRELELVLDANFDSGNTLLFMDEIQSCPEALGSLRYFYEEKSEIPIIAAGSLLDFEFRNQPFPVGRVEVMQLHPLTFKEFLIAKGREKLANLLDEPAQGLSQTIDELLEEELNTYFVVGGMPAAVKAYIETEQFNEVLSIQDNLLYAYEQDFKKYQPVINSDCLNDILEKSSQLTGNQIQYTKLSERFSGPTIKKGVDVLCTAHLLKKVENVGISGLPLTPSGKQFKLFHLDIGLLLRKSKLTFKDNFVQKSLTAAFNGMLADQFVAQQLNATSPDELCYWARTASGSASEVDFVITKEGGILPIEVKAGKGGSMKSLHYLLDHNSHIKKAVVFSKSKFGVDDKIHFLPLYYADYNQL